MKKVFVCYTRRYCKVWYASGAVREYRGRVPFTVARFIARASLGRAFDFWEDGYMYYGEVM